MKRPSEQQIRTMCWMHAPVEGDEQYWHGWWSVIAFLEHTQISRRPWTTVRSLLNNGWIEKCEVQNRAGDWLGSMLRLTPKAVAFLRSAP